MEEDNKAQGKQSPLYVHIGYMLRSHKLWRLDKYSINHPNVKKCQFYWVELTFLLYFLLYCLSIVISFSFKAKNLLDFLENQNNNIGCKLLVSTLIL